MKSSVTAIPRQDGVALVTALLFLLVVTVLAVTAANNSALGLEMSARMQDAYGSFQSAEAGAYAALGLASGPHDPFTRQNFVADPFQGVAGADHPLRNQAADPNDVPVDVDVILISTQHTCPRPPSNRGGSGADIFDCDYYRIQSEHDEPGQARTQVELGVVKTVIGSG